MHEGVQNKRCAMAEFEFIVIGGGSAGMALAARLSEAGRQTLLLEAGVERLKPWDFWKVSLPATYSSVFQNPAANWMYEPRFLS